MMNTKTETSASPSSFEISMHTFGGHKEAIPAVTSLQVAQAFGKRHDHVIRDIQQTIRKCPESFNAPNFGGVTYKDAKGEERPMYLLSKDGLMMLTMGYTTPKAMEIKVAYIAKFNEMEEALKRQGQERMDTAFPDDFPPIPPTYAEALRAYASQIDYSAALERKIEADRPKVAFAEAVAESTKATISVGELAKLIRQTTGMDIGQNRLFDWLRRNGYLHKYGTQRNLPTEKSAKNGLIVFKESISFSPRGDRFINRTARITGKGQQYFIDRLLKCAV